MIIAVIPAKRNSTRLANKNLLEITGQSLVARAIAYARNSKRISEIYVSTDDSEIESHALNLGVKVIRRGAELAGEAPLIDVYRHVLSKINNPAITHLVGIQPDHPDRKSDMDAMVDYAINKGIDDLFTVDKKGVRNGSLRIISMNALKCQPAIYASAVMDDCTNIHTNYDFLMARYALTRKSTLRVKNHEIGLNSPVFVIAEGACNHMCDMTLAMKMIDKAAESGADAIKFQTYKAEKLVTSNAVAFWGEENISQLEYYRRLDKFDKNNYKELFDYATSKGIIGFSSPFDEESVAMLADLGMPLFKIASCDICNIDHLKLVARYGRPIILSTGASTVEEIDKAIEVIFSEGNQQLALLACTLSYPTKNEDANLSRIRELQRRYPLITVGFSDHTPPDRHMVIPALAVSLGAKIIEKHFTLDRTMTGSGHFFAVDPEDLSKMVENIRLAESVIGDGTFGIADSEKKAWESARRSIVAGVTIKEGTLITRQMLELKRPATGLLGNMMDFVVGKKAKRDIQIDEQILLDMIK